MLSNTRSELSGGLSIFVISLPQAIAYGGIAFFPLGAAGISFGILSAVISSVVLLIIPALLRGTRGMVYGPRASSALIFASFLTTQMSLGLDAQTAVLVCFVGIFIAGIFQSILGLLRIGVLAQYVPYPLVLGILNATAVIIILRELDYIFSQSHTLEFNSILEIIDWLFEPTVVFALSVMVLILVLKKYKKYMPPHFIGLAIASVVYYLISTYSEIDLGLTYEHADFSNLSQLILITNLSDGLFATIEQNIFSIMSVASVLTLLESLDTLITSSLYGRKINVRIEGNRDLFTQGVANSVSGLLGGISGSCSTIRTISNFEAGGRGYLSTLFPIVFFAILFATPWQIVFLPVMATSGLLLVVGIELADGRTFLQLKHLIKTKFLFWDSNGPDLVLIGIVVITAIIYDLPIAVGVGALSALIYFVHQQGRSLIRRVFYCDTTHSRTVRDFTSESFLRNNGRCIVILELEGALFFASTVELEKKIENLINGGADHIILDMRRVTDLDTSGIECLKGLSTRLEKQKVFLCVSFVAEERRKRISRKEKIIERERREMSSQRLLWRKFDECNAFEYLDEEYFFIDTDEALSFCEEKLLRKLKALGDTSTILNSIMLKNLSQKEVQIIRRHMVTRSFNSGHTIFTQNEIGNEIFFLRKGQANVYIKITGTDRLVRVSTLLPGTIFGEMAILNDGIRSANVVGKSRCVCYCLSVEGLETLKEKHPIIALKILENMGRLFAFRLQDANHLIRDLEA